MRSLRGYKFRRLDLAVFLTAFNAIFNPIIEASGLHFILRWVFMIFITEYLYTASRLQLFLITFLTDEKINVEIFCGLLWNSRWTLHGYILMRTWEALWCLFYDWSVFLLSICLHKFVIETDILDLLMQILLEEEFLWVYQWVYKFSLFFAVIFILLVLVAHFYKLWLILQNFYWLLYWKIEKNKVTVF